MRILICPDKFKGSLSAIEVIDHASKGILRSLKNTEIIARPLADGGEGSLEVIASLIDCKRVEVVVNDPLFRKITAHYLLDNNDNAYIEMAHASGLALLAKEERNCMQTTSFGTGELIKHALGEGAEEVYLFVGGSATCDGGMGMVAALGYKFIDADGLELSPIGKNMTKIKSIIEPSSKLQGKFNVLVDVNNPFYGLNGASFVFAPQKGASEDEVKYLDSGLKNFSEIISEKYKVNLQKINGSGAAGGIAGGACVFLDAEIISGFEFMSELMNLDHEIKEADLVITGEGKVDSQTWEGKVVSGIITLCQKHNRPTVVICGISESKPKDYPCLKAIIELQKSDITQKYALENAGSLLEKRMENYFKKIQDE